MIRVSSSFAIIRKGWLDSTSTRRLQSSFVPLHSEIIGNRSDGDETIKTSSSVFLHGLLGNGRNLKTFAGKVCKVQKNKGYLIDLRGHGKSRIISDDDSSITPSSSSFEDCVGDVIQATSAFDVESIVGHSFGGRMALQYAAKVENPSLRRVWLLDTVPGKANESVEQVIHAVDKILTEIQHQAGTDEDWDRNQIVTKFQELGIDIAIAQWLASSYKNKDFGFDLQVIQDILPDFMTQDFYGLLNSILQEGKNIRVDLVRGGKNKEWDIDTLRKLEGIQSEYSNKFALHVLPKAGHWVHVDDLPGLISLFERHNTTSR